MGLGHSLATMQKKKTVKVPRGKASEESLEVVPRGSEELKTAERSFVQRHDIQKEEAMDSAGRPKQKMGT